LDGWVLFRCPSARYARGVTNEGTDAVGQLAELSDRRRVGASADDRRLVDLTSAPAGARARLASGAGLLVRQAIQSPRDRSCGRRCRRLQARFRAAGACATVSDRCVYCGNSSRYLPVSVAHVSFAVHSDVMSSSGAERYYWCLSHQRVETEGTMCPSTDRLGPYASAADATQALDRVRQRNEEWDAEDDRWEGGH
jgi:hypothetical protein